VTWAHGAGLTVTPCTFRSSNTGTYPTVRHEMAKFLYEYGVDALFTDNPDQFPRGNR
jgi:glycerophosphoryl diester phosphodiesterase